MSGYVRAGLTAGFLAAAFPAFAQSEPGALSEAQKRKIHLPYVRAATNCFARAIIASPEATRLARSVQWGDAVLSTAKGFCQAEVGTLLSTHDQLYGQGTGQAFFVGPYFSDLPRALGNRLRPEFERVAANEARVEAVRQQELARLEAEKRERIEQAQSLFTLLRDKMYECTDAQLVSLVASAESADVLATAAMTVCNKEVNLAVEAGKAKVRLAAPGSYTASFGTELKAAVRQRIVTNAVQAKAAWNSPRPSTPPTQPSPVVPVAVAPAEPQAVETPSTAVVASPTTVCLRTIAKAREGKFVNQEGLVKAMLDLCRPEIENAARTAFLKDDKASLEKLRDKALEDALREARVIVGATN